MWIYRNRNNLTDVQKVGTFSWVSQQAAWVMGRTHQWNRCADQFYIRLRKLSLTFFWKILFIYLREEDHKKRKAEGKGETHFELSKTPKREWILGHWFLGLSWGFSSSTKKHGPHTLIWCLLITHYSTALPCIHINSDLSNSWAPHPMHWQLFWVLLNIAKYVMHQFFHKKSMKESPVSSMECLPVFLN